MESVFFILSNVLALIVAFLASDLSFRGREAWRRFLAGVAGFPIVVTTVIVSLGTFGFLSAQLLVMTLGVMAVVLFLARMKYAGSMIESSPKVITGDDGNHREDILWPLSVMLLAGVGGVLILQAGFNPTEFQWDDLTYHATSPAQWLIDGRLTLAPYGYQTYFPMNAELMSFWFMLPFGNDTFVSLSGLYWATLAVVSIIVLCLSQKQQKSTAIWIAALLLSSPIVISAARNFCAADMAGPALSLAAVALIIPSPGFTARGIRHVDIVYSGLLAGLAIGTKAFAAPVLVVIFLWLFFGQRQMVAGKIRLRYAAIFTLCVLLMGGYWYARNLFVTGNPVFPAESGLFAGPFDADAQQRTKLIHWITNNPTDWQMFKRLLEGHPANIKWPFGLALLSLIGYAATAYAMIRRKTLENKNRSIVCFLLLTIGVLSLLLYPFLPFSGTSNLPEALPRVRMRYIITPFAFGLVLFSSLLETKGNRRAIWISLSVLAAVSAWEGSETAKVLIVLLGAAGLLLRNTLDAVFTHSRVRRAVCLTVVTALLAAMAYRAPQKFEASHKNIYAYMGPRRPIGDAWRELEKLPAGSKIAWFANPAHESFQLYPLYGRNLQLRPLPVLPDGIPHQPLHKHWRESNIKWWETKEPDLSNLAENLINSGAEYCLITKYYSYKDEPWPKQYDILINDDRFQPVYNDNYSIILHVPKAN